MTTLGQAADLDAGLNNDPRIRKMQREDRWRIEKAHQLPLDFLVKSIEAEPSDDHTHRFVMQVEGASLAWQVHFGLEDLQRLIKDLARAFPIEAGKVGKHERILPTPPPSPRRRFLSSKVSPKERAALLERIKPAISALLGLPDYIRHCKLVASFFLVNHEFCSSTHAPNATPTPPPSTVDMAESSSFFGDSTSTGTGDNTSKGTSTAPPLRIKVKVGDEVAMVQCDPAKGFHHFRANVQQKFAQIQGGSFRCPDLLVYTEYPGGDDIVVGDDEDLMVACQLNQTLLTLKVLLLDG